MKKIGVLVGMLLIVMGTSAFASDLAFKNPRFLNDGTPLTVLQEGDITFSVDVTNSSLTDKPMLLFLNLLEKGSNQIVDYKKLYSVVSTGTQTLSSDINVSDPEKYYVTAYVWDGMRTMRNLSELYFIGDEPSIPESPQSLVNHLSSVGSISLKWNEAYDGLGIKNYNIYRNDQLIGTSDTEFFTDISPLEANEYSIEAVGLAGGISSKSELITAQKKPVVAYDFEQDIAYNVTLGTGSDGRDYASTVVDGVNCVEIKTGYLYFKADSSLIPSTENQILLLVEYFDKGTGFTVHYNTNKTSGSNGEMNFAPIGVSATGDQRWKTAVIILNDAGFRGAANGGDFRITGGGTTLKKVSIYPKAKSFDRAYLTFNSFLDGVLLSRKSQENDAPISIYEGESCASLTTSSSKIVIAADQNYITANDNFVTFVIRYFDNGEGNIPIHYKTTEGVEEQLLIERTNTNQWKDITLAVKDAKFDKSIETGDVKIGMSETDPIYIAKVEIIPGYAFQGGE